jgi:hypothetical protein
VPSQNRAMALSRRRPPTEIEGLGQNWMSHHQIPRLDRDRLERCDGNLPFAGRLIALLSMTPLVAQAFAEGEIPFSGRGSNGGFWSRKVENALSFNGD